VLASLLSAYRLRVAADGATALRMAQQEPPDLILLDVLMPGLDGFEVCRRLQADPRTCEIPVIFITALGDHENETVGFQVGGVDYITKPFNPMVVRARVQTHLELKAVWDALRDENARLESRVEARTAQLQAVLDRLRESAIDTVLRLGLAAEYKDDQTGRHVLRMATMRWQWPDSWAGTPRISIDSSTLLSCTTSESSLCPTASCKRQDR